MKIVLCIDDTDSIEKGKGTGSLAQDIAGIIEDNGWGTCERITRHQLLLHEDIPYTSHNSSMCFAAEVDEKYFDVIISEASNYLIREHAEGSDPGLCVLAVDKLENHDKLIRFGISAKKEVLTKEQAYELAKELNIHLSEHGGTGQGIIGALAGAGLRLSGNDGEFKGCLSFVKDNDIKTVFETCMHDEVDYVMSLQGEILDDNEKLLFTKKSKAVLNNNKAVLLVSKSKDEDSKEIWKVCNKKQLRVYGDEKNIY